MSMEVEILDIYKGTEERKSVTVWGDPGHLCRPYLSTFKEGGNYIIAFGGAGGQPGEKRQTIPSAFVVRSGLPLTIPVK